jgi:hypothetical protein
MAQQPPVGQGLFIKEDPRSCSDTPQSVGFLWTVDQPVAENTTWQHTTFTIDWSPCPRRDSNPQSSQASGPTPKNARSLGLTACTSMYNFDYQLCNSLVYGSSFTNPLWFVGFNLLFRHLNDFLFLNFWSYWDGFEMYLLPQPHYVSITTT